MLAYLAHRPAVAPRRSSPNLLLFIVAGHVAVVALVMSAKMDLPTKIRKLPTEVYLVPSTPLPEERPQPERAPAPQPHRNLAVPDPVVPLPADPSTALPRDPDPLPLPDGPSGPGPDLTPAQPIPATPAVLLTSLSELKPPYPAAKLASGEEALLKLRLTVAPDGRVVAVEPIGRADKTFLESARRHIIAHWRYRPATRDGRDVMATLVVSLRFQLDD